MVKNLAENEILIYYRSEFYKNPRTLVIPVCWETGIAMFCSHWRSCAIFHPTVGLNFQVPVIFQLYLDMFSTASSMFLRKNFLVNNALAIAYIRKTALQRKIKPCVMSAVDRIARAVHGGWKLGLSTRLEKVLHEMIGVTVFQRKRKTRWIPPLERLLKWNQHMSRPSHVWILP